MSVKPHNFWYAVNNTEIVLMPSSPLETFGATHLHYHMVSELMDTVNQVRIREGTIQSHRPQIITPTYYEDELARGFGEQAQEYIEWLRTHSQDMRILQYGFQLQKTELSEQVISGNPTEVLERVKQDVEARDDKLAGVILGVDDPWDVCLMKFMVDVIRNSAPVNFQELNRRRLLDDANGVPRAIRHEIEHLFLAASRNPAHIKNLSSYLRRHGLFGEYEDRFFALLPRA
ncbi:MAG: hypothetical protein ABR497_01065 [Kiritimatiellia bacterium]|nr:hypothetical protein [Lentisphaerota bacterium]